MFYSSYKSQLRKANEIIQPNRKVSDEVIDLEEIKKLEIDFYSFIKGAWPQYQPHVKFQDAYHLQKAAEHIEELYYGRISKLILNIIPGFGKSTVGGAFLTPWVWANSPGNKFFYTGIKYTEVERDSVFARDIIQSEWYQERWGHKVTLKDDNNTKKRFTNTAGGVRAIGTIGGRVTGLRTNWTVVDDPNDATLMTSKAHTDKVVYYLDRALSTRQDITGVAQRFLLIQQRLDITDATAHFLSKEDPDLVVLYLSMEYNPKYHCVTVPLKSTNGKKWEDPRTEPGELLWPTVFPKESVEKGKLALGSKSAVAAQYQQQPISEDGAIIDISKFQMWKSTHTPVCDFIIQSWDTALTATEDSDCSAVTNWGLFTDKDGVRNIILLSMWMGKRLYPELRRFIKRLSNHCLDTDIDNPNPIGPEPNIILMEAKASGFPFIQDLREANIPIQPFNPNQVGIQYPTKRRRVEAITPFIDLGLVWLPGMPPYYQKFNKMATRFMEECAIFDKGEYKDLIDTMSQAFIYLKNTHRLKNPTNPLISPKPDFSKFKKR